MEPPWDYWNHHGIDRITGTTIKLIDGITGIHWIHGIQGYHGIDGRVWANWYSRELVVLQGFEWFCGILGIHEIHGLDWFHRFCLAEEVFDDFGVDWMLQSLPLDFKMHWKTWEWCAHLESMESMDAMETMESMDSISGVRVLGRARPRLHMAWIKNQARRMF